MQTQTFSQFYPLLCLTVVCSWTTFLLHRCNDACWSVSTVSASVQSINIFPWKKKTKHQLVKILWCNAAWHSSPSVFCCRPHNHGLWQASAYLWLSIQTYTLIFVSDSLTGCKRRVLIIFVCTMLFNRCNFSIMSVWLESSMGVNVVSAYVVLCVCFGFFY